MEEERQEPVWPVLVTLAVALTLMLVSGVAVGVGAMVLAVSRGEKPDVIALLATPWVLVTMLALSQGIVLLSVRFLPVLFKDVGAQGWAHRVGWKPERFHLSRAVLAWVGTLGAGQVASYLLQGLHSRDDMLSRFASTSRDADPVTFSAMLLIGGLVAGFGEEFLFRGLAQPRFISRIGVVRGIVLTAALFGAYHLDVRQGLAAMILGCWLGWFAWRDGSVVNVAFGHAFNNMTAFILSRIIGQPDDLDASPWVAVSGLVLVTVCVLLTLRFVPRAPVEEVRSAP